MKFTPSSFRSKKKFSDFVEEEGYCFICSLTSLFFSFFVNLRYNLDSGEEKK